MSEFDDWFKKQTGEDTQTCNWFITFMRSSSSDADEVERIFERHHGILIANEMVEELQGTIEIMKGRLPHPAALSVIGKVRDRVSLIEDTRRFGVREAIERHKRKADFEQKIFPSKWFNKFMTSDDVDEVEQVFRDHQAAVLKPEAVEILNGMIAGFKDFGMNPHTLQATRKVQDRISLIEDVLKSGFTVKGAISRHRQKNGYT